MFSRACRTAAGFTRPVVISRRYFDRSTDTGCGAFLVVNDEGWIVTAAHLLSPYDRIINDAEKIVAYLATIRELGQQEGLPASERSERIRRVPYDPRWLLDVSYWWGADGASLCDVRPLPEGDLVLGRLAPFDPDARNLYPAFKSPHELRVGTSLCRIGYPFQAIPAMFREASNSFELGPGARELSILPMEGLYTRTLAAGKSRDGRFDIKFLETSSPGLKGQSGGPIFDVNGTVWGVQSRTDHYAYGSVPCTERDGREVEESQCINLGVGIHPEVIVRFLADNGVRFSLSEY